MGFLLPGTTRLVDAQQLSGVGSKLHASDVRGVSSRNGSGWRVYGDQRLYEHDWIHAAVFAHEILYVFGGILQLWRADVRARRLAVQFKLELRNRRVRHLL